MMPGAPFSTDSSTLLSLPPGTGQAVIAANTMPGTCASMPNFADPSVLWTTSTRVGGEFAVAQALTRRFMRHHALRGSAFRRRNVQARRGSGNQALARAGTDLLHPLLRLPD